MASDTIFDICTRALIAVGQPGITSFTGSDASTVAASAFYDSTKRQLLAKHPWRFAAKSILISKLTGTPDSAYSTAYQLPGLLVQVRGLRAGTIKVDPFEIFGDQIHCDETDDTLELDYIANVNEDAMTEWFVEILENALASKFAMALSESPSKAGFYQQQAELLIRRAKFVDSLQDTPNTIEPTTFIQLRR
jgi:hypothetical protein